MASQVTFEIDSTERSIDARAATVMKTVTMSSILYFGAKPNISYSTQLIVSTVQSVTVIAQLFPRDAPYNR